MVSIVNRLGEFFKKLSNDVNPSFSKKTAPFYPFRYC
jgi:hypothetical protein